MRESTNNGLLKQSVLTNRGIIDIWDVNPGDYVYNYTTHKKMEVVDTHVLPIGNIYYVGYSDGNSYIYHHDSYIVTGIRKGKNDIIFTRSTMAESCSPSQLCRPITRFDIDLLESDIDTTILESTDPYLFSPFLVYGYTDDPYVNLPCWVQASVAFPRFCDHIYVTTGNHLLISGSRIYVVDANDRKITWEEFLGEPSNDLYVDQIDRIRKYIYTSKICRQKFLRGVFDIGYDISSTSDGTAAIFGDNHGTMSAVSCILSSVGYTSIVQYDHVRNANIRNVSLIVSTGNIPELFYDPQIVANYVNDRHKQPKHSNEIYIKHIIKMPQSSIGVKLIFDRSNGITGSYLSGNLLPIHIQ